MIFKNPLKTGFSLRDILIEICFRCVWIVIYIYNGLLKVIGIKKYVMMSFK